VGLKEDIYDEVVAGHAPEVKSLASQAMEEGLDAQEVLNESLIAGLVEVGDRFEKGDLWVPEMLVSARAMRWGVEVLRPFLAEEGSKPIGTYVIGTVAGDLHDIGKNLVIMMLEGNGFRVIDLGIDVPAEVFVEKVREHSPQFVGMSALLTTTLPSMKRTIDALEAAGLRDGVVVMIGGAPVTQRYADQIGADIYASDASAAARIARETIEKRPGAAV
jgi:5-methyltetrahydrofolate--homocysteine methyltransferase